MTAKTDLAAERPYRCDYAKFAVKMEPDRIQKLYREWRDCIQGGDPTLDAPQDNSFKSVRINPDGTRLYVFQVWGERATTVRYLDWSVWSKYLERIDVREETDVSRKGIEALYNYASSHNTARRNIQLFTSRSRSKRDGRPAGGDGLAIGSHKSDFRFSIYKRGTERGACEFQLSGDFLKRCSAIVNMGRTQSYELPVNDPWGSLMSYLRTASWAELGSTVGLSKEDVTLIASGDDKQQVILEATLSNLEAAFKELPRDAQEAFVLAAQHHLFE